MSANSMILVSSLWREIPTFKMIPTSKDCPYNECIYDPQEGILAIVSKEKKETYHLLPKLTETGDILMVKNNHKRADGKPYAEQRVLMDTYYEYFIRNRSEIEDIIRLFAANADVFDYAKYFTSFTEKPNPTPAVSTAS